MEWIPEMHIPVFRKLPHPTETTCENDDCERRIPVGEADQFGGLCEDCYYDYDERMRADEQDELREDEE